jgi:O-antigen ligase
MPNSPSADSGLIAQRIFTTATGIFLFVMPFTSSVAVRNCAMGLGFAAMLVLLWKRRVTPPPVPSLLWRAIVVWAAYCAATWLWSVDRAYSGRELNPEVLLPIISFGVFFAGADAPAVRRWSWTLLLGVAALALLALAEVAWTGTWHPLRLHAGVGWYSTWLAMVFPLVLALALPLPQVHGIAGSWRWMVLAALLLLIGGSAYLTLNRFVWPAFATSLAVFCALSVSRGRMNGQDRKRLLAMGALVFAVILGSFALAAANKARLDYPDAATVQESLAQDARLKVWRHALSRISESPITGHGFGRGILSQEFVTTLDDPDLWQAHNVFLDILLELGALGLLAFLFLLLALVSRYVAYLRAESMPLNALGAIGAALLVGFVAKNITDDFFAKHVALLFWSLNGMLIGFGERLLRNGVAAVSTT